MPGTVRCGELGVDLPQASARALRAEAARCSATATAGHSGLDTAPAQEEPVESASPQSPGERKAPVLPLKPGASLARLRGGTCPRLWCIAACQGDHFNVLYLLLCLSRLLSSVWFQCLVPAGFQGEVLCGPRPG